MDKEWNKKLMWAGPVTVLTFVVILTIMYGLVGSEGSIGLETIEAPERPEVFAAAQIQTVPDNRIDMQMRGGQIEQQGQIVHHGTVPTGIGGNQMQLIHQPTSFPSGIGGNQMQLINKPTFSTGIGGNQMQLINKPTFSTGIGNGQIKLVNTPTYSTGIGNGQIRLINQNRPGGPYLGLSLGEVNGVVAKELKLPKGTGVYVNGVVNASPAQKAGIKKGDIILKCGHKATGNPEMVAQILAKKKAGDVVKLVVNRNGKKRSYHAKLENAPMGLNVGAIQNPIWMGADIQDIDAVMKIQFNLPDNRGVIVSHVAQNSPAQAAGLHTGDVIRRVDATRIRDVKQLQDLVLGSQPGQKLQLTVYRNGRNGNLNLVVGQRSPTASPRAPFLGPADVAIEGTWIGMDVTELSAGDVSALGLAAGTRGILVNDVESPPATMVGFQTGDVIVAVNGHATYDMKRFKAATQQQSGAVVDTIRGNKHLFMSVPPPGFTAQGTQINTGINNKMRQVAMARPAGGKLGVLAAAPELSANVSGSRNNASVMVLVDLNSDAYATVGIQDPNLLTEAVHRYGITSVVCSDMSHDAAAQLTSRGVHVYPGVSGSVWDAIRLYEGNQLTPMR